MLENKEPCNSGHEIAEGTYNQKSIQFIARRVIVKLKDVEGERDLEDSVESVVSTLSAAEGSKLLRGPGPSGRMVILLPEGENVIDWALRLSGNERVAYAEPDIVDWAQVVPNDTRYVNQWGPPKVNAEAAWNLETGDPNVVIGIIDSGISMTSGALDHDDLSTSGRFTLGTDFVDGGTPRDFNGHGTHVCGIAAGKGNNSVGIAGMNWNSPVYICRTLSTSGSGSSADFADAVEEITDYAISVGKKAVINYSAGGGANQTKKDACQYASDNGMLVVAATGNDNGGPVIWPAAYSTTITGVVAVGSTDSDDTVSSFSNVGPEVTVVAPGRSILSTTPTYTVFIPGLALDYDTLSGTSMATPMVTGLAALMWSRHPGHTNAKIKQCLQDTAVELGSGSFDNSWGYGRVDALAALRCGDLVLPTKIGHLCVPSLLSSSCASLLTICKSHLAVCKSHLGVCKSLLVFSCPKSVLQICLSKLPNLCPSSKLTLCKSKLLCPEPQTHLISCGEFKSVLACPSAVDACPSAPGGCFDPGIVERFDPVDIRIGKLERQIGELRQEKWYKADIGDNPGEGGGDWFYVDDDGEIHQV